MQGYIGKDVQLIYVDSKRNVSIRKIKVIMAGEKRFMAYCYQAQAIRTFNKIGIVDMEVIRLGKTTGKHVVGIE